MYSHSMNKDKRSLFPKPSQGDDILENAFSKNQN